MATLLVNEDHPLDFNTDSSISKRSSTMRRTSKLLLSSRVVLLLVVCTSMMVWMPCDATSSRQQRRAQISFRGVSNNSKTNGKGKGKGKGSIDEDVDEDDAEDMGEDTEDDIDSRSEPDVNLPDFTDPETTSGPSFAPVLPSVSPTKAPTAVPMPTMSAPPSDMPSGYPTAMPQEVIGDADDRPNNMPQEAVGSVDDLSGGDERGDDPADPSDEENGTETSEAPVFSESAVYCPGITPTRRESVWWTYAVTLESAEFNEVDADGAVESLELQLRSNVLDLMECNNPVGGRKLDSDLGIVGIDYLPVDLRDEECPNSSRLPCYVFRGEMYLFLSEDATTDVAFFEARKAIQRMMTETGALSVSKVENVAYLKPDLSDPSAIGTDANTNKSVIAGDDGGSATFPVLAAVGGLFVVMSILMVYRYKKTSYVDKVDAPSTIADGSQITGADSNLSSKSGGPEYGFNGMLPQSYRMGEPTQMRAILEDSSDSASQARSSDIVVSESGYTDDDCSRDHSDLNGSLVDDPILGARGMDDYDPEEDYLFDTGEIVSDPSLISARSTAADGSQ